VPVPKSANILFTFFAKSQPLQNDIICAVEGTAVTSGRLLLARFVWATFKNAQKALFFGIPVLPPSERRRYRSCRFWLVGKGVKQMKKDGKPAGGGHNKGKNESGHRMRIVNICHQRSQSQIPFEIKVVTCPAFRR